MLKSKLSQYNIILISKIVVLFLFLFSCGNKTDLYLEKPSEISVKNKSDIKINKEKQKHNNLTMENSKNTSIQIKQLSMNDKTEQLSMNNRIEQLSMSNIATIESRDIEQINTNDAVKIDLVKTACINSNGMWKEFLNGCADFCNVNINSLCAQSLTYSCNCGEERCFDSKTNSCIERVTR